jgi:hypothetical protein
MVSPLLRQAIGDPGVDSSAERNVRGGRNPAGEDWFSEYAAPPGLAICGSMGSTEISRLRRWAAAKAWKRLGISVH